MVIIILSGLLLYSLLVIIILTLLIIQNDNNSKELNTLRLYREQTKGLEEKAKDSAETINRLTLRLNILKKENERLRDDELIAKANNKCNTCDSYVKGICECNQKLGYDYCTEKNGYIGYRQIIKEME